MPRRNNIRSPISHQWEEFCWKLIWKIPGKDFQLAGSRVSDDSSLTPKNVIEAATTSRLITTNIMGAGSRVMGLSKRPARSEATTRDIISMKVFSEEATPI